MSMCVCVLMMAGRRERREWWHENRDRWCGRACVRVLRLDTHETTFDLLMIEDCV